MKSKWIWTWAFIWAVPLALGYTFLPHLRFIWFGLVVIVAVALGIQHARKFP